MSSKFPSLRNALALLSLSLFAGLLGCGGSSNGPEEDPPEPTLVEQAEEYFGVSIRETPGNPTTDAGVALGRRLFYDPILSGDDSLPCAGCHVQAFAFSDAGNAFSRGIHGDLGTVNAPAIVNAGFSARFFWNGRSPTLEAQALEPVPNEIEMDLPWNEAIAKLSAHPEYPQLFERAFGRPEIDADRVTQAIAQFQRTFVSFNSRWDRNRRGEIGLTPDELMGFNLYRDETKGDCFHCHGLGPIFDNAVFPTGPQVFVNNGLDADPDPGRFEVTSLESDRGKFKVPTLRNVEVTGPYMHDGRFATLEEVVRFYNTGIHYESPNMDSKLGGNARKRESGDLPTWTDDEIRQLVAFLKSLTDPEFLTREELSDPFAP